MYKKRLLVTTGILLFIFMIFSFIDFQSVKCNLTSNLTKLDAQLRDASCSKLFKFSKRVRELGDGTIYLSGPIDARMTKEIKSMSIPSKIRLNSVGGDAASGLEIGEYIRDKNIGVSVEGVCFSSCANYIFLGAKSRQIDRGLVGFHGDISTTFSRPETLVSIKNTPNSSLALKYISELIAREDNFFSSIGFNKELIVDSDNFAYERQYRVTLPTKSKFLKYGIIVNGDQSGDMIKLYQDKIGPFLLY